jgi:hypothetical protein
VGRGADPIQALAAVSALVPASAEDTTAKGQ